MVVRCMGYALTVQLIRKKAEIKTDNFQPVNKSARLSGLLRICRGQAAFKFILEAFTDAINHHLSPSKAT